ncbi:hypothetical protein DICPUDRAFT_151446 [Dictyostelium purpureum]|uniref:Leucine-rich repeat-containing protein n=1 Tax=Dictyostelium purpureum TaxID=5786 RepID=F0ZIV5_DICPU|nr:uncharacterized protein DICPUDRAFT_151446 [Dictyostelium purpureum]EGC36109.1 hypothetical protein DICPUDRAFT_151446 [Dictyostelium purpureum]|eukprot:XP_003287366.1 hypothetical protein DICPUDRAFT_151446 [Dictyostelium purpureum]
MSIEIPSLFSLCVDKINLYLKNNKNNEDYNHNNNNNDNNEDDNELSFEFNRDHTPLSILFKNCSSILINNNSSGNSNNNSNKIKLYNSFLKSLIDKNKLTIEHLYNISISLPLHFITHLDLRSNVVNNNHCYIISNISNCNQLGDSALKYISEFPRIETLDISNNINISDQGFNYLMNSNSLKELIAKSTPLTDNSIIETIEANNKYIEGEIIQQPFPSLETLILTNTFISNSSLSLFLQLQSILSIDLFGSKCTIEGFNQFQNSVLFKKSLNNKNKKCIVNSTLMTIYMDQTNNNSNNNNNSNKTSDKNNNKLWPIDDIINFILNCKLNNNSNNNCNTSLNTSVSSLDCSIDSLNSSSNNIFNDKKIYDIIKDEPFIIETIPPFPIKPISTSESILDFLGNKTPTKTPIKSKNNYSPTSPSPLGKAVTETTKKSNKQLQFSLLKDPFSNSPTKRELSKIHQSPSHLNIYSKVSMNQSFNEGSTQKLLFSPSKKANNSINNQIFKTMATPLISPKSVRRYDSKIYDDFISSDDDDDDTDTDNDDDDDDDISDQEKEIYATPKKLKKPPKSQSISPNKLKSIKNNNKENNIDNNNNINNGYYLTPTKGVSKKRKSFPQSTNKNKNNNNNINNNNNNCKKQNTKKKLIFDKED